MAPISSHVNTLPALSACRLYPVYAELEAEFLSGALHPGDLKLCLTEYINK
jgi:hypothetical protein